MFHLLKTIDEFGVRSHTVDERIRQMQCLCNCVNSAM